MTLNKILFIIFIIYLKGISQNLDNGSKNSENQKKDEDEVQPKIAQNSPFV